jgi:hypothetical protein
MNPLDKLSKMSPELEALMAENAKFMTTPELQQLQQKIEALLEERDRLKMALKMSKEQLLQLYNTYGYSPKAGDKFYKIRAMGRGQGFYGWQVGHYEHSCHIDTTDIIVLLVIEPGPNPQTYIVDFSDNWLEGPILV